MRNKVLISFVITMSSLCAAPIGANPARPDLPSPITEADFRPFDPARAALGQLLFYDKVLSGNRNIACATCHNHDTMSADGLSLGIGEGGIGVGTERRVPEGPMHPQHRMPRNVPALFNIGHADITVMLHDGRVSVGDFYDNGFNTPIEEWLPKGLNSVLAAQSLMPLTSDVEMAGQKEENDIAAAANRRIDRVWPALAERVASIPAYVDLFVAAFPDVNSAEDITPVYIANALDDFQNSEWRAVHSPFDAYLAGDTDALTPAQKRGLDLFYGKANCASCHSGPLLTDQGFYALAIPPFGPGRTRKFDPFPRDLGRMGETDRPEDAYRFRTPPLRNVALTAPYGHNGAFATLEGIVRHHLDPQASFDAWDRSQVIMPTSASFDPIDFVIWEDAREIARVRARVDITPVDLTDAEVADILAFLDALTDRDSAGGRLGKPAAVPSGLPVD